MPSKSPAQARLMQAAASDRKFAQKVGIPQSIAKEFAAADKGSKLLAKSKNPGTKKLRG